MSNVSSFMSCSIELCQNNGQCLLHNSSIGNFTCLCTKCFTGTFCEMKKYSDNLWYMGLSDEKRFSNYRRIEAIVGFLLAIASFLSNFLALQTFLCSRKIRITNLGVYLILLSSTCLIVSIIRSVFTFVSFVIDVPKLGNTYKLVQCAVTNLLATSLIFCLFWLILYIAIERILIEYSLFSLYDSRRRSLISSLCLYIIVPVINISLSIYGRKANYLFSDFCLLDFTSTAYIAYSIFRLMNYLAAPVASLIAFFFILHNLLRHRLYITANGSSLSSSIKLLIINHRDFILQPLSFVLCVLPNVILGLVVTCPTADTYTLGKLRTIFALLSDSALITIFFTYVSLSKLYMEEFWHESYIGRFLLFIKARSSTVIFRKLSSTLSTSTVVNV